MGMDPFNFSDAILCILAQRLVRRICPECREAVEITDEILAELDLTREEVEGANFYRGTGCGSCSNTGYKGRVGLFEVNTVKKVIFMIVMLLIAGVFAIMAFFSGANQFDPFIGNPKEWMANTHRVLGIASAISIWLWYLCLVIKPLKKLTWVFAIITVILVSITGLYGGVLAH